jgi:hypothetical protein
MAASLGKTARRIRRHVKSKTVVDQKYTVTPTYRISKSTKRNMVLVAVAFDLAPMLIMAAVLIFAGLLAASMVPEVDPNPIKRMALAGAEQVIRLFYLGGVEYAKDAATSAAGAIIGAIAAVKFGPFLVMLLYRVISTVVTLISFVTFATWFALRGVYIWRIDARRMGINMFVGCLGFVPILNLLPDTVAMVLLHVKVSRMEDGEKAQKSAKKLQRKMVRRSRQRMNTQQEALMPA